jgi:hypothetical protein
MSAHGRTSEIQVTFAPAIKPGDRPGAISVGLGGVIVYVLTHNEANEGGTVEGVYSSEQKAREEAARRPLPGGEDSLFFWAIEPFEVDGPTGRLDPIRLD